MPATSYLPVVTVSATYGAGGSVITPRLAAELSLPFVDRMIGGDLGAGTIEASRSREGLSDGEQELTPAGRFLSYFARAASVGAMMAPDPLLEDDDQIRARSEAALSGLLAGAAAVVLGRAGAVVLAGRPRAFHVRLDGPVERRVAWAARHEGLDLADAHKRQSETDRARTTFVKRLYRADPNDSRLYHLVLDPTAFGVERSTRILAGAARDFFEANP
jgi:cytidylate kinase